MLKQFINNGLEHWGSDARGVNTTRRFLLEWLSFLHRYVPLGIQERPVEYKINLQPYRFVGRNDLETLMASKYAEDWIKITELLLGKAPSGYFFTPKHAANSYNPSK